MECKYSKGKIYKVVDVGYSKCYFGSTTEKLYNRFSKHKNIYKQYLAGKRNDRTSTGKLFAEFGTENCKIELVENYPCNSKEELNAREGFYIQNNECVNTLVAGRTQKERYELNKSKIFARANELGKEPYICEVCDCEMKKWNKKRHVKTIKHQNNLKQKSEIKEEQ